MDSDSEQLRQARRHLIAEEAGIDQQLEIIAAISTQIEFVNNLDPTAVKSSTDVIGEAKEVLGAAKFDNLTLMLFAFAGTFAAHKRQKQLRDELEVREIR